MIEGLNVRLAVPVDAADISKLIYATSALCCFCPEAPCPVWYEDSIQADQIAHFITAKEIVWIVAVLNKKIIGVLAIGDKNYVTCFFVYPKFQKLGIGRKMWEHAFNIDALGDALTVRSSLFAVPVYERLGFKAVEPPRIFNGLQYQTMISNHA